MTPEASEPPPRDAVREMGPARVMKQQMPVNGDFSRADLRGCDFGPRVGEMAEIPTAPAKLDGADFKGASLSEAVLNGVDLRRSRG